MRDNNDNNVDDNLENMAMLGGLLNLQGQQQAHQQRTKQSQELQRLRQTAEREGRARAQEAQTREQEVQARIAEESRIKRLPQCPACGGRLEGQFRKCMHCTSELSWVEGIPCELGKEHEVHERLREERVEALRREEASKQRRLQLVNEQQQKNEALKQRQLQLEKEQQQKEEASKQRQLQLENEQQQKWERLQSEMDQLTIALPDNCPKCSRPRPGSPCPRPSTEQSLGDCLAYAENWILTTRQHGCCPECRPSIAMEYCLLVGSIAIGLILGVLFYIVLADYLKMPLDSTVGGEAPTTATLLALNYSSPPMSRPGGWGRATLPDPSRTRSPARCWGLEDSTPATPHFSLFVTVERLATKWAKRSNGCFDVTDCSERENRTSAHWRSVAATGWLGSGVFARPQQS